MPARIFTFICEFRAATYVSQIPASAEPEAVNVWAVTLREQRPFGRASSYLAKAVEAGSKSASPVAIDGVESVWCITASCGGDLMVTHIVETAQLAAGS